MTAYEYDIEGFYSSEWERVHTETDKREAAARVAEYRAAEQGTAFRVRRVKVTA